MAGGGKGGKAPQAPDLVGLAQQQGVINADAARLGTQLSRVNQITPYGSVTYRHAAGSGGSGGPSVSIPENGMMMGQGAGGMYGGLAQALRAKQGGSPGYPSSAGPQASDQWEQVVQLSPEQQKLFDINQGNQIALGQTASDRLKDIAGQGSFDPSQFDRQHIEDSIYGAQTRYLDPQFQNREAATKTSLLNSGIREGSEAYQNAMDQIGRDRTMAYGEARDRAIASGGAESSRSLSDALRERMEPLQEFMSLYGGAQPNVPGAQVGSAQSVSPYDLMNAANQQYQSQVDLYNQRSAGNAGMLGGLMQLGGTLGSAYMQSDERLKEDIEPLGALPDGTNVYEYSFRADPERKREVGVMAQEVERVQPDAVMKGPDGYRQVDYAKVIARALRAA